jgi:hypothetical protein
MPARQAALRRRRHPHLCHSRRSRTDNNRGYMASYYLTNQTDSIDGLPLC